MLCFFLFSCSNQQQEEREENQQQEEREKMGKHLDSLLGRTFKTSKFKTLAKLAISRIAILNNQHQVRYSHARSDAVELLNLDHQERALLRVEHVIKEQNMLDVFFMIESYCNLLIERNKLIHNRECPDEIKEAISSLLFAASRCGEFPELQEIRKVYVSWFGKEFAVRATELRNNCGVNPKIIQKFSARQPSSESKMKVLKEIASQSGITLHLKEDRYMISKVQQQQQQLEEDHDATVLPKERVETINQMQQEPKKSASFDNPEDRDGSFDLPDGIKREETFSESIKARKINYRDVAAAAQEAFESAAYAAAAARAAVELSRSESWDNDSDDHNSSSNHQHEETLTDSDGSLKLHIDDDAALKVVEHSNERLDFNKIHHINNFSFDSEVEEMEENSYRIQFRESENRRIITGIDMSVDASSLVSEVDTLDQQSPNQLGQIEQMGKVPTNYGIDDENLKGNIPWFHHDVDSDRRPSSPMSKSSKIRNFTAVADEDILNKDEYEIHYQSPKSLKSQADPMAHSLERKSMLVSQHSNIGRKPVSMRTRRAPRDE